MWNPFAIASAVAESVFRTEQIVGAVADALTGVKEQLAKAKGEILAKIADLEAQVAAGGMDPADVSAIEELKALGGDLDAIVPDNPVEPPV